MRDCAPDPRAASYHEPEITPSSFTYRPMNSSGRPSETTPGTKASYWALFVPLGAFYVLLLENVALSLRRNANHFVYPLDDTYIHMAMAKNFAYHHVWGVTQHQFTSASSSPLYTAVLALCYWVFGAREVVPLLLGILFVTLTLLATHRILRTNGSNPVFTACVLLALIVFTPLVALASTGMEHTLHLLLTVVFVYASARLLAGVDTSGRTRAAIAAMATILPMVRYEGLFTVAVVCVLLLLKRRTVYAFSLGALALLPVALFGAFSVHKGWYALPNSVLLKGNAPDLASFAGVAHTLLAGYTQLIEAPHLAALAIAALLALWMHFRRGGALASTGALMIVVFIANLALHLQFAKTGWVYRYEAYLIALGILAIGMSVPVESVREAWHGKIELKVTAIVLIALLASPLALRGVTSLYRIPHASTNIYGQQYQMAAFVRRYYQGRTIAANDIGAINYFADIHCLDLYGLADIDVARAKRAKAYDTRRIADIAANDNVDIALVYKEWYDPNGGLPAEWIKIGEWQTLNNEILGGDTVSFYAVKPAERARLAANFRSFSAHLPANMLAREVPGT